MVAHGVTFGVMILMILLIHMAPLGATPETKNLYVKEGRGYARFHAYPWARVEVDGKEVGLTPIEQPTELVQGERVVKFFHEYYEPIERRVYIPSSSIDQAQIVAVDFCNVGKVAAGKTLPTDACGRVPKAEEP